MEDNLDIKNKVEAVLFATGRFVEIEELASNSGCQAEIISIDTREGQQLKDLGGVAAPIKV